MLDTLNSVSLIICIGNIPCLPGCSCTYAESHWGHIVVGLLAFVLGVCVTVLCFRIRRLNEEEQTGEQKGENTDGSHQ